MRFKVKVDNTLISEFIHHEKDAIEEAEIIMEMELTRPIPGRLVEITSAGETIKLFALSEVNKNREYMEIL